MSIEHVILLTLFALHFTISPSHAKDELNAENKSYAEALALIAKDDSAEKHALIKNLLDKAASENSVPAIQRLAEFYYFGDHGFEKKAEHALHYAKKGAALKNPWCQNLLGTMYEYGQGIPKSKFNATFWYEEAAKQGFAKAQSNLGLILRSGSPVREDVITAFAWLTLAAKQNEITAIKQLEGFAHTITPEEKAVANEKIAKIEASLRKPDAP
jgi:TPR repeat protein